MVLRYPNQQIDKISISAIKENRAVDRTERSVIAVNANATMDGLVNDVTVHCRHCHA